MKRLLGYFKGMPHRLRDYWKTRYSSPFIHMTRGAQLVRNMLRFAHKDSWRRNGKK